MVIEQQRAVIGITQQRPWIEVQESTRPVLALQRQMPRLEISGGGVSVRIDQTECFAERGYKPPAAFADECVRAGRQAAQDGVARRTAEGDFLASIEQEAGIADLVISEECEVVLALLPRTRPTIEVLEEPLQFTVAPGRVTLDFTPGTVSVEVPSWPYLRVYLQQEPFIRIRAVPEKIDVAV